MRYQETLDALVDFCHLAKLFELTNCQEFRKYEASFILLTYKNIGYLHGGLRDEDRERVKTALPSVEFLAEGIYYPPKHPDLELSFKSAVVFLTEDFPELEALGYVDQMGEINDNIDKWLKTGIPFDSYHTYLSVRNPINDGNFDKYIWPEHHYWWNLWKGVTKIKGIPLKKAKKQHKKDFPKIPLSP